MKFVRKFLFIYGFILTLSMFVQGIGRFKSVSDLILQTILFSFVLFFSMTNIRRIFKLENKLDRALEILKKINLVSSSALLLVASFGLIFRFEYIFLMMILPLPLYFTLAVFYKEKSKAPVASKSVTQIAEVTVLENVTKDLTGFVSEDPNEDPIGDPLKRKFIKLIGGSGLGILLLALFKPKSAEASFFGSVPGPGTVAIKDSSDSKIDPAIKSPIDAYGVTQIDDSSPAYYGFVNKDGAWYITKEDSAGAYRYNKGVASFTSNWANRASLSYDYFDAIF